MLIHSIKFTNLRSFKEAELDFGKCNHITGRNLDNGDNNGTGKSTLVLAMLLLLGGAKFADINLKKFIRNEEKSAKIEGSIEVHGDILEITRTLRSTGTAKLNVIINGEDPECKTPKDYQNLLFEYIGEIDNFKKFRLLDTNSGINILDFTSGQLRKTLMAMCQGKFDNIRQKLLEKKALFEKYNKELVVSKHAPSAKRLKVLETAIQKLDTTKLQAIMKKLQEYQMDKNKLLTEKGKISQDQYIKNQQLNKFKSMAQCPECKQKVTDEYKKPILNNLYEKIKVLTKQITQIVEDLNMYTDIIGDEDKKRSVIYQDKQKLNNLKYKLETRLAQKDYKYTKEDIEIAKKAVDAIDEFANYYILEWINVIEPIVNSYISKLNMSLSFASSDTNKLEVLITRGENSYTYDQLSNGEKVFISTIFKIALLLERQEQGCMFADESFDCLSIENLERLIGIVSELPIQLFFVTHQSEYFHENAKNIYIEKKDGVSKIKSKEDV